VLGLLVVTFFDLSIFAMYLSGMMPSYLLLSSIACIIGIYICCVALFSLYQPQLFTKRVPELDEDEAPENGGLGSQNSEGPQLRNVELSPDLATELGENLDRLVIAQDLHLEEDMSLPKLAALLGISRSQLSELLNVHRDTSFYDFMNSLRHNEAIRLLHAGGDALSVSDIAYRSGFNNRSSFYRVFKSKTGQTPGEYRRANVA